MELSIIFKYAPMLLQGLQLTIIISIGGIICSLALGSVLVALSRSGIRAVVILVRVYTEIILGIPVLVLLYLIYFVLPEVGIRFSEIP